MKGYSKDWQKQHSYRVAVAKSVRQLRERWKADLNWDPEQHGGPYPLIIWSGNVLAK